MSKAGRLHGRVSARCGLQGTESFKRKSAIKFVNNVTELLGVIGFVIF
jgi:hypothetical protein